METAMERLSSGKRINSAMDDAAGLSISHSMNAQVTAMNQATRNANDGIAMINLAEGAMDQITDMLTRMKEIATQSANGIYNQSDRDNLSAEYEALTTEIDRVANVTTYNGQNVLNNSAGAVSFQVGDAAGDAIGVTFKDVRASAIGTTTTTSTTSPATTSYTLQEVVAAPDGTTSPDIDNSTAATGLNGAAQVNEYQLDTADISADEVLRITINGETFTQALASNSADEADIDATLTLLMNQINGSDVGVTASIRTTSSTAGDPDNVLTLTENGQTLDSTGTLNDYPGFTTDGLGVYSVTTTAGTSSSSTSVTSVTSTGVLSATTANSAIGVLNDAIKFVDSYRSELGAAANTLEHTVGNLMTRAQHTSAAMSRIMDADYATESANLAKAQVLQQAGTAMLAQANASTQNVLSLLK
jgi:flagellin